MLCKPMSAHGYSGMLPHLAGGGTGGVPLLAPQHVWEGRVEHGILAGVLLQVPPARQRQPLSLFRACKACQAVWEGLRSAHKLAGTAVCAPQASSYLDAHSRQVLVLGRWWAGGMVQSGESRAGEDPHLLALGSALGTSKLVTMTSSGLRQ